MIKREDYFTANDYGRHAIFDKLMRERDNVIALAKKSLMDNGLSEKEALAVIFSHLHGGTGRHTVKPTGPYNYKQ